MAFEFIKLLNRRGYGKAEFPEAVTKPELTPLFDYAAEVEAAKKAWPKLQKQLGMEDGAKAK